MDDYIRLMTRWGDVWERLRARHQKKSAPDLDKHILLGWLGLGNRGRTIVEVTLKTWAAFAGDARGNRPVDWLEAYVLRHTLSPNGQRALGKIALAALKSDAAAGVPRTTLREICTPILQKPDGTFETDLDSFINGLINKRLLVKQGKDRVNFRCGLATAYCAATALAAEPSALPPNRAAALWTWALYFLAPLGDLTSIVTQHLTQPADVLLSEPLTCARWLRDAPATVKWRNEVFRRLSKIALDNTLPENLRLRALSGFVAANDFAVAALFKQALASPDPFARRIAALGLGALGDATAVPAVAKLFGDPYLDVRWAAALALGTLGTEAAVQALKQGLLTGDDGVKQACAQSLGRHPELGHPVLKETIASPDLGVRRATLYGLAEVNEDWARHLIEETQRNEQEWYVRNAANELYTRIQEPPSRAPKPYLPPESQGWLVAWAAQKGVGVPPGKGAVEVLGRALREGEESARIAAAEALARLNDPIAARELYGALRDPSMPLVRDAAFRALAHLSAATGQRLNAPG
jgi:HEAT repeat protein